MTTFNIQISAEQLELIKLALELQKGMSDSNDLEAADLIQYRTALLTENDIEETNMLIGMIEDVIDGDDWESTHGFCY